MHGRNKAHLVDLERSLKNVKRLQKRARLFSVPVEENRLILAVNLVDLEKSLNKCQMIAKF